MSMASSIEKAANRASAFQVLAEMFHKETYRMDEMVTRIEIKAGELRSISNNEQQKPGQ